VAACAAVSSDADEVSASEHRKELERLRSEVVQVETELERSLTELSEQPQPADITYTEQDTLSAAGPQVRITTVVVSYWSSSTYNNRSCNKRL